MITLDTETCGLVGPIVTIQYAEDDDQVHIHEIWSQPVGATLRLIDRLVEHPGGICGFNLTFDWFHIQRLQNVLCFLPWDKAPTVEGWQRVQRTATEGPCVKPVTAMDVFLHARKGPCQALMNRDDVRIRRVPIALAQMLADHLGGLIKLDPIYFSRRKKGMVWEVDETSLAEDPNFPDVVLHFGSRSGLKPLSRHLLGVEAADYPVEQSKFPEEDEWNPFSDKWKHLLPYHISFWRRNKTARKYARDDVVLTRALWKHFGSPKPGDDDSILACQIASARWRGYALDIPALDAIRSAANAKKVSAPRAPKTVLYELHQRMNNVERVATTDTRKETLFEIAKWDGPAGAFARNVIAARSAEKEEDVCLKLLTVGRFHPDFKIIGALSGRMAGAGGLNAQGIPTKKKGSNLRAAFRLASGSLPVLDGGDFDAFEVSLAAAVYQDTNLITDLQTGKKIHGLFGASMFGDEYEDVMEDADRYGRAKNAFFGKLYGAEVPKLAETLGLTEEQVKSGAERFEDRYPGVGAARKKIADDFCSMRQPKGIGTAVEWHDPADYVESIFGFRRYFSLENSICRALFDLAQSPPKEFNSLYRYGAPVGAESDYRFGAAPNWPKVQRRANRWQTPGGAAQSALFACAFGIQAAAMRAAANHTIQASGATITKRLQCAIWDAQPSGVHEWVVQPMNIHDELMVPRRNDCSLTETVNTVLDSFRPRVPLIKMAWKPNLANWGAK